MQIQTALTNSSIKRNVLEACAVVEGAVKDGILADAYPCNFFQAAAPVKGRGKVPLSFKTHVLNLLKGGAGGEGVIEAGRGACGFINFREIKVFGLHFLQLFTVVEGSYRTAQLCRHHFVGGSYVYKGRASEAVTVKCACAVVRK